MAVVELNQDFDPSDVVTAAAITPVELTDAAQSGLPAPHSAVTRRLYAADWGAFVAWCRQEHQTALPATPSSVAAYLSSLSASLAPGALGRRTAAIADRHRRACHASPCTDMVVGDVLRAARAARKSDSAPASSPKGARSRSRPRRRRPHSNALLERMAARCPSDLAGLRDRSLLLLTAAGVSGERLLALDREHVRLGSHQVELVLVMPDGGAGEVVVIHRGALSTTCPVRALDHWLSSSDTRFGPLFRKVDRWGNVEHQRLRADGLRRIFQRRGVVGRRARPNAADTP
ncbi:hypothetical protein HN018_24705 (plasmid) [Lichenicola cladoniae]|uniref:Uncharacterized protein n=1 Tax=Lichenicola cladoniae TaxID=1484109 RepID=A0A6M8HZ22_9PROT|nr:hypothetical protein [Lichenicola cladoniae]NPD70040.1 hypothetical protein [Acetobacteraceae bacterium]QKE93395.1 hypothetical protein HN018_24705 [Lichenicola cladoniae]